MYCNKCGAKINIQEDLFCINCGAKVVVRTPEVVVPSGLTSDAEEDIRIIDDFFTLDNSKVLKQAELTEELGCELTVDSIIKPEPEPQPEPVEEAITLPEIDLSDLELFEIPEIVLEFKGPDEDGVVMVFADKSAEEAEPVKAEADACPDLPEFTPELILRDRPQGTNGFEKSVEEEAKKTMDMVDEMFKELASSDKHKTNDARANLSKAVEAALQEAKRK